MTEGNNPPLVERERIPPPPEMPPVLRMGDLLGEFEADARMRNDALRTGVPFGPLTGIKALDEEFGGAIPQGLHIIHGGPGVGKTALGLQIAATCQCPAVYLSAEMAPLELMRRHTARVTETYLGRFKSGEMPPAQALERAMRAAATAPDLHIVDATMAYAPEPWVRDIGRDAKRIGDSIHLLIVVDSLHSWAEGNPNQGAEYDVVSDGCRQLRNLSSQLKCAVIAIAERNRQSQATGGVHAARGSGKIEYGAESVISLDAEESLNEWRPVKAKFGKNRNGSAGASVNLEFHGATQTYREAGR